MAGLRAVAVLAVVANHVCGWPTGGFVGVDVFFVISGFVITLLIRREVETTGGISLGAFYRRRIKRITPIALIVLASSTAAGFLLLSATRASSTATDAIWSVLLVANRRFAASGVDYFQSTSPPSPLQHFWSLAVEEQFYLVWPILVFALATVGLLRARRRIRPVIGVLAGLVIAGSFAWALVETSTDPTTAYFSTGSRAWEIATGALVAAVSESAARLGQATRAVLFWIGLVGIIASVFLVTDGMPFPAPTAAGPVVSTALVIFAGSAGHLPGTRLLSNRAVGGVGAASYPLYLWHFPVIVFGDALLDGSPARIPVLLGVSGALAASTHLLVERPILSSPWLTSSLTGERLSNEWRRWASNTASRLRPLALGHLVVVSVLVIGSALAGERTPPPSSGPEPAFSFSEAPSSTGQASDRLDESSPEVLTAALSRALTATAWPTLKTAEKSTVGGDDAPPGVQRCSATPDSPACAWGPADARKSVVMLGDSTSLAYTQALIDTAKQPGSDWKVRTRAMFGCPFVDYDAADTDKGRVDRCRQRKADAIDFVEKSRPDAVVITNLMVVGARESDGRRLTPAEFSASLSSMITKVAAYTDKVVVLPSIPVQADVEACLTPRSSPPDCITTVTNEYSTLFAASNTAAATTPHATVLDPRPLACVSDSCPAFVDDILVKSDLNHITPLFAHRIAPVLRTMLQKEGVFSPAAA